MFDQLIFCRATGRLSLPKAIFKAMLAEFWNNTIFCQNLTVSAVSMHVNRRLALQLRHISVFLAGLFFQGLYLTGLFFWGLSRSGWVPKRLSRRTFRDCWAGILYRPDAIPVTEPTVSKHWMGNWMALWKSRTFRCISFFHPSLNRVLFPMFCLLVEGECQILVF